MRKRVEEGLWVAKPPYGYRVTPGQPGRIVADEETAPIVREQFARYLAGGACSDLAVWRNTLTLENGARRTTASGGISCPRSCARPSAIPAI
jgi:hypothetical protein